MIRLLQPVEVYKQTQDALNQKRPFSVVRCGDGEVIILDHKKDPARANKHFMKHLGYVPHIKGIRLIKNSIVQAFQTADIMGVSRESVMPYVSNDRPTNPHWAGTMDMLARFMDFSSVQFTDRDIHYELLINEFYYSLFQQTRAIYYVASRNIDDALKNKFHVNHVFSYHIAPQHNNDPDYSGPRHFPEQFTEIERWISGLDCTGALCLVGAGYTGKVYCSWFKQQGGVVLDVGSVFDRWVGRRTRGKGFNAPYKYDNTYTLLHSL